MEQPSLPNDSPSLPLRVETHQAILSQDIAPGRATRFLWASFGLAVVMLTGVSAYALLPIASHTSAHPSRLTPEVAFMPSLSGLHPGSVGAHPKPLRPAVRPGVAATKQRQPMAVPRMSAAADGGSVAEALEIAKTLTPSQRQAIDKLLDQIPQEGAIEISIPWDDVNDAEAAAVNEPLEKTPVVAEVDDESSRENYARTRWKSEIYALAAFASRGESATTEQREDMRELVQRLKNPTLAPARAEALSGTWELLYESSGYPFRSSPFFWGVGKLMDDFIPSSADFFYGAHEHQTSLFGGGCGTCLQKISDGALESDVVVKASLGVPLVGFGPVFSAYGNVITKGKTRVVDDDTIAMPLASLSTTLRQDDKSIVPALNFMNGMTVPVGDVMDRVADADAEVTMRITYLDEDLRVSELQDGTQLIYRRRA